MNSSDESTIAPPDLASERELPTPPPSPKLHPSLRKEKPLPARCPTANRPQLGGSSRIHASKESPSVQQVKDSSATPTFTQAGAKTESSRKQVVKDIKQASAPSSHFKAIPIDGNHDLKPTSEVQVAAVKNTNTGTGARKDSRKTRQPRVSRKRKGSGPDKATPSNAKRPARRRAQKGKKETAQPKKGLIGTYASLPTSNALSKGRVTSAAWAVHEEHRLPSIQSWLSSARGDVNLRSDEWLLEQVRSKEDESIVLPPLKHLLRPEESMPIDRLNTAAMTAGVRKAIPIEQHCFAKLGKTGAHLGSANGPGGPSNNLQIASNVDDLRAQNEAFAREILALRGQLVLAHGNGDRADSVTSQDMGALQGFDGLSTSSCFVHRAIALTYMASQVSSFGLAAIPKDIPLNFSCDGHNNPYLQCAKDGFEFIRSQMVLHMDSKSIKVVTTVFKNVHLQIAESILGKPSTSKGQARPVLTEVVSFFIAQVKMMLESMLVPDTNININWSKVISADMVLPLRNCLKKFSSDIEQDLQSAVADVFKSAASSVRAWEKNPSSTSVQNLCNAFEVSMSLAVSLSDRVLLVPPDILFDLGRHNPLFSHHIIRLEALRKSSDAKPTPD